MNEENLQAHIRLARTYLAISAAFAVVFLVLAVLTALSFLGTALLNQPGEGAVFGFAALLTAGMGIQSARNAGEAYHNWRTAQELLALLRERNADPS